MSRFVQPAPALPDVYADDAERYPRPGIREILARTVDLVVLPENAAMRKVFSKFGFQPRRWQDPKVIHLVLTL